MSQSNVFDLYPVHRNLCFKGVDILVDQDRTHRTSDSRRVIHPERDPREEVDVERGLDQGYLVGGM